MLRESFHNTIQVEGSQLDLFNSVAKTQEDSVLEVFRLTKVPMAWFEVHSFLPDMNECSLKRSISNLAEKGKLEKILDKGQMVTGKSGKPCHRYKLINTTV